MKTSIGIFNVNRGWAGIGWGKDGITLLILPENKKHLLKRKLLAAAGKRYPGCALIFRSVPAVWKKRIALYFKGGAQGLSNLPVDLSGFTAFQKRVWKQTSRIPPGRTVTYSELAAAAGNPLGARAVGQALGKNPIPVIIPCHRIVASGGLGGFSLGMRWKKTLLDLERQLILDKE